MQSVTNQDPKIEAFDWLEDLRSERSLSWVEAENQRSLDIIEAEPAFVSLKGEALRILGAADKIPSVTILGDRVYNFWQDAQHIRGIWRRAFWQDYISGQAQWEILFDLDAYARRHGMNYSFTSYECLDQHSSRCLIKLSDGGCDAGIWREFDLDRKEFVEAGFELPHSKSELLWLNQDELLFACAVTEDSRTESGLPREIRRWKRGQDWQESEVIFRGSKRDGWVGAYVERDGDCSHIFFKRARNIFTADFFYELPNGEVRTLPLPAEIQFRGVFKDRVIFRNRRAFGSIPAGSLAAIPLAQLLAGDASAECIFSPTAKQTFNEVLKGKNYLYVNLLDNVKGRIDRWELCGAQWMRETLPLAGDGAAYLDVVDPLSDRLLVSYEDFLTPESLYAVDGRHLQPKLVMQMPARFSSEKLTAEQRFATSADGTQVPYFIIRPRDQPLDASSPTILYGYGGFEVPMAPSYMPMTGKLWLERGGSFVLANIRGGGEFGPNWHQSAILKNRQRAFDDFTAVARDLIAHRFTSPQHLGISGGSNGGLLVGVSFTQHPELYNAIVCKVPLLDMLRYHKLMNGASWMAEYGDPDDPEMHGVLEAYSPFHNLREHTQYPEALFVTSTADDRVHPAHARKMAARMQSLGKAFFYYENTVGGHRVASDLQLEARLHAIEYSYLWMKLGAQPRN